MEERGARCERCSYFRLPSILCLHHVLPRSKGGKDEPSNLELICPNCHAEVHYGGIA
ncbi:MAG: HNH endonuclease signature motif containing protein [Pyrinomonadaceae bacterium]